MPRSSRIVLPDCPHHIVQDVEKGDRFIFVGQSGRVGIAHRSLVARSFYGGPCPPYQADIIVGGLEAGGAVTAGVAGVVLSTQPEFWPFASTAFSFCSYSGVDAIIRKSTGIDRLRKTKKH